MQVMVQLISRVYEGDGERVEVRVVYGWCMVHEGGGDGGVWMCEGDARRVEVLGVYGGGRDGV